MTWRTKGRRLSEHDASPLEGVSYYCVECECGVRPGDPHFEEMVCEGCYKRKPQIEEDAK